MSNIDFSQMVSAQERAAQNQQSHRAAAKAECARRISQVLDMPTASNLQAAAILGQLSAPQMKAFAASQVWVGMMRTTAAKLAKTPAADPCEDAHWPAVPKAVVALAKRY